MRQNFLTSDDTKRFLAALKNNNKDLIVKLLDEGEPVFLIAAAQLEGFAGFLYSEILPLVSDNKEVKHFICRYCRPFKPIGEQQGHK